MAVFKATKNKSDSAGKFKATEHRSYDSALVSAWETRRKESYDALEKYRQRINSGGYLSADDLTAYRKALDSYVETSTSLRGLSKGLGQGKDDDNQWTKTIADMETGYKGISDYFSQWKTEDAFKKAIEASKEREAKLSLDTEAYGKELDALVAQRDAYIKELDASDSSIGTDNVDRAAMDLVGKIEELEKQIQERKLYLSDANRLQEGVRLAGVGDKDSEYYDPEFGKYASLGAGVENPEFEDVQGWFNIGSWNPFGEDPKNKVTYTRENWDKYMSKAAGGFASGGSAKPEHYQMNELYTYMTEDEVSIYNYYLAKNGDEAADKYLDSITKTLTARKANKVFEPIEDNVLLELAFGVAAGLDQFGSGIEGLADAFTGNEEYKSPSSTQMVSGMVREDLSDFGPNLPKWMGGASLGQAGYDVVTTTSNMLPSILTSTAVNLVAPGAGSIVGTGLLGASAGGNAYREMINLGYDKGQARAYAALVGGSEAIMQSLLGGISSLSGGGTDGIFQSIAGKLLPHVDKAFARTAIKLGANMLDEGLEEGLQEILTPWFQNMVLNADAKVDWSEVAYSSLLGALTAGIMEGPGTIFGEVNAYTQGRKLLKSDFSAERLAEIGKTFSADTVAYQLAGKVNENTGAYTIGRLFNAIGATMTEQNVNDITNALVAKGWDEATARKNAEALAYVVEGGQLTDRQTAIIEANEGLAEVARSVLIDANSTVNQRTKGYNEAVMALAQEQTGAKSSRTNPAQQSTENAPADGTVDTAKENGAESASEVDTGPAKVKSIAAIKNKRATVALEDGTEADVRDVDLDPNDGVRIETIASIDGITATDANFVLKTLRENTGASAQMDALGAKDAFKYGFYGFSKDMMTKHAVFANSLTEAQRNAIYEAGQKARQQQIEKAAPKTTAKQRGIYFDHGGGNVVAFKDADKKTLTEDKRKAGVQVAMILNKLGIGGSIYFFESYRNAKGQLVYRDSTGKEVKAPNGWYSEKDGSIHIDLNSGRAGNGLVLYTLSHELTHFIEQWSPAKYKILADFLIENYEKGQSMDALIRKKQAKLSELRGEEISYDEAYSEVIADSMEAMLSDGNVLEKLIELKAKDQSLFAKMKQFFDNLLTKIRNAYKGQAPDSYEGNAVLEMTDSIKRIQQLFAEALVEASENLQESLSPGEEGTVVNESGEPVAHATSDGTIQLSMRTYEDEGRKAFREYLNKCVKNDRLTQAEMQEMLTGIEEIYQVCKEFKDKYAPFSTWSDAAVVRDTYGKPVFSVVTPNGDYKMNLDFSLVCKKRRTLDAVFNEMSKRGIIDDFELGQKSVVKINEIIRKYGLETACALCFVDAKRFRQASMADQFTSLYNELVLSLVPEDQRGNIDRFNFAGYDTIKKVDNGIHTWDKSKLDFSHLDDVMKNYGKGTVEHKAAKYIKAHAEGRRLLLRGDFMSSKGFDAVKTQNKDILKLYNSKKGTGGPKAAFGDVQYMNEIIKKSKNWTPEKAYAVGGVRIQSFSDYVPRMVFDYVQMIYDLAATKLPAHAYTKESLFVKQFGLTGIKINMSLIPAVAEGGIAPGLDANGNYVWAGESFDFDTAKEIQNADGYTENCGTICVGVSYQHIVKLLSDTEIRMVIPYHKSGLNPIVAHMNKIAEFTDYTTLLTNPGGCQNTMDKNGNKVAVDFNFNEVLHKTGDPKATVRQYLNWCAKNEYKPRFAEFAWHENYYKLIEDFTLYDKNGKYVPQREVRAVFPTKDSAFGSMKDLIQSGLEEDAIVEGKRDASLSSIVDEIQNTLPKTEAEISEEQVAQADHDLEEVKNSDRDYSYEALTSKPDMMVTDVGGNVPKNRADVVAVAKKNAARVGRFDPKTGSVSVHVNDMDVDVLLGTDGLKHGLRRTKDAQNDANYIVTVKAGEILKNSIKVNEITPKKHNATGSYVLIGIAKNASGDMYIVRSVVNQFNNELASMDVLYAINAKKELAATKSPRSTAEPLSVTSSSISITELLDIVNQHFPDILPEDVLKHYGYDARPEGDLGENVLYSDRDFPSNAEDIAKEYFGTTKKWSETGWLLRDGTQLDFSGRHWERDPENEIDLGESYYSGKRNMEHYEIAEAFPELREFSRMEYRGEHLDRFQNRGNIRIVGKGIVAIEKMPTEEQFEKLHSYFRENIDRGIVVGIGRDGMNFNAGTNPSIIVEGIRDYFSRNRRKQSELMRFHTMFSDRDTESVSNRSLLANAFEGVAQNDIEKQKVQEYKSQISLIEAEERKLSELNQKIKDLSFAKGPRDTKAIRDLQFKARQTANRINTMDKILLRLEASKPLQDVLTREKEKVRKREQQKGKEALATYRLKAEAKQSETLRDYRETRAALRQTNSDAAVMEREFIRIAKAYEKLDAKSTEKTGKDAKTIADLKSALKEESKKHRDDQKTWEAEFNRLVREYEASGRSIAKLEEKIERQKANAKARVEGREKTAMRHKIKDIVNELNQYLLKGTKDRHVPIGLQKAVAEALNAVNMDTVGADERISKLNDELLKAKTPEAIQEISKRIDNIRQMGDRMDEKLKKLKSAYDEFIDSDDPLIANSHDDAVSAHMMRLIVQVGDTPLRDMTMDQLQAVYDVYKIVLATIRNANKSFKDNKNREISTRANQVMAEIDKLGVKRGKRPVFMDWVEKFGWDGLKPVYAMEHIGSQVLIDAYNNVRAGEDTWARDIVEAREYYLDKFRKYKYDSWDFEKKFKFTSTTGKDFELTLDQIMSLYAFSKRDQAADHLKYGGIVFDPKTEVVEKTKSGIKVKYNVANATAYNISEETLADIISKLTADQRAFVNEMQTYLSDVMGAKGNEVSLAMYDVKLFREKHYFPLKSAHQYMAKAKEQAQGDVKIKNSGFSKETKPHAKNPIVLSSFMDVWTSHVNEMSMYHAFVLPMEDFYRIYNYATPSKNENMPTESVNAYIENAYGAGATGYIEQMLKDLNGGARTDSRTGIMGKLIGLHKKGAVFASLSVVVQQPSAIARAAALVDTKYFIGPKVDQKRHKALWDEVKQYAPVAIIKEMGYFDTNMGKSTQDYITGQEYSGFKAWKALVTDSNYRDEILSKLPALADEVAWCGIWEAVKRETKAKHPSMDVGSDAFLKMAGERFTEVITKTQVYDSVLSRSAMMRSKDTGMKMATAFMAEPTTSINMIADALLQGKRGNRKYCRTTIGAVVASQIINSILVSLVYAARDDDEDKTFAEKYIGSLTQEILDSLNPATYLPFIKDIVSIAQGYDVERADMSIISDLWKAWQKLSSDNFSVYQKVEAFGGSIAQLLGLPVKNIMRDVRGIYQTIMSFVSGPQTTAAGIGYAVKSAIPEWLGGGDTSNQNQLYEAYLSGDKTQIARVESRYKDQSSITSAIRKALRENDPRILKAAQAVVNGNGIERANIAREIASEGHFSLQDIQAAINAEIDKLRKEAKGN